MPGPPDELWNHVAALRAIARRRCPEAADAEDLVQDTFLRALRAWPTYDDRGNLRGWLFTILHRLTVDRRRRSTRAPPLDDITKHEVPIPEAGEAPAWHAISIERVHETLAQVPPVLRTTFELHASGHSGCSKRRNARGPDGDRKDGLESRAMRTVVLALLLAACGGKESKKETPPLAAPMGDAAVAVVPAAPPAPADAAVEETKVSPPPPLAGHDFTPAAKALLVVGACGEGPIPQGFSESMVKAHCDVVDKVQAEYTKTWLEIARPFIAERVPKGLPKQVVYPFAGGDLSTALTVYPDADEITTLSLEPAGDPRTLDALNTPTPHAERSSTKVGKAPPALAKALGTVRYELDFLYRVIFSNTLNMIDAMRGGALPTQLIFGLSAMKVHGFEVESLRYFKLGDDGAIAYLTDDEVKKAPGVNTGNAALRNRIFANAEIRFRKPGGRTQIYRHIQVNLDDDHLRKDPRVLRHLEQKGDVAGMTKAASYLLSWTNFSVVRDYMIRHVVWMISDCTGIAPKWGKPVGFEYETYGQFVGPHIGAGNQISKDWEAEFKAEPKREMPFRFGYYDKKGANHMVLMKRGPSFQAPPPAAPPKGKVVKTTK